MSKKVISASILLALCLATVAQAANIIWVSDNKNGTSTPSDQGFVDLLKAQGYSVDYQGQAGTGTPGYQFWRTARQRENRDAERRRSHYCEPRPQQRRLRQQCD